MRNFESIRIAVVIPVWNGGAKTIQCLDSIENWNVGRFCVDVFVLDNASNDSYDDILKNYRFSINKNINYLYVRNEVHIGLTASLNKFYQSLVPGSYAYLVRHDNDVILESDAFSKLIDSMERNSNIAIMAPRLYYRSRPAELNGGAVYVNKWGFKNLILDSSKLIVCDVVIGAMVAFRVSDLQLIQRWFDPSLYLFSEELEISFALKYKNRLTALEGAAIGYHDCATSTGKTKEMSCYLNHRNLTLVMNRIFPWYINLIRNTLLLPRVFVRCLHRRDSLPFYGFKDGLIGKKLNDSWWQRNLNNKSFVKP